MYCPIGANFMKNPVLIPNINALLETDIELSLEEMKAKIEKALGVTFYDDLSGNFEETTPAVSHVFTYTVALFDEEVENTNKTKFTILLEANLSLSYIDLKLEQCKFISFSISKLLAELIATQTQIVFTPTNSLIAQDTQKDDALKQEITDVPVLQTIAYTYTSLPLNQIAARVGAALGVSFSPIILNHGYQVSGSSEDLWYTCSANALAHIVTLNAAKSPDNTSMDRVVKLDLGFDNSLTNLIDITHHKIIKLDVFDYITALLNKETNLNFRAIPKKE